MWQNLNDSILLKISAPKPYGAFLLSCEAHSDERSRMFANILLKSRMITGTRSLTERLHMQLTIVASLFVPWFLKQYGGTNKPIFIKTYEAEMEPLLFAQIHFKRPIDVDGFICHYRSYLEKGVELIVHGQLENLLKNKPIVLSLEFIENLRSKGWEFDEKAAHHYNLIPAEPAPTT